LADFRENIGFPEVTRKTGANGRGIMKKLAVLQNFEVFSQ
jgi:hypothetical protein